MKVTSFVIVDKQTGKAVMETFNRATADAVNRNKFDVLPTLEYLQKLNRDLSMERKSNPTKKFSPAQIAAQKLFAERARAGTLGKTVKRKANPDTEMSLGGNKYGKVRPSADGYGGQIFTAFYFQKSKTGFRDEVETDLIESKDFKTMGGATKWLASQNRKTNPDKSKPRAYVKRASQATGAPPSKRLVTRRKKALSAPAGYFPNPKVKYTNRAKDMQGDQRVGYAVHMADRPSYQAIAWFSKKDDAVKVAQEASDRTGKQLAVTRVQNYFGAM